jgi:phage gp45-like
MLDALGRVLAPLNRAIDNMVARAVIRLAQSGGQTQQLQADLSAGETKNDLDLLEGYGLTAVPLPGAIAVCLFVGGERENGAAILAHDQGKRPRTLEPGDVALYTDQDDPAASADEATHRITLGRDRSVTLRGKRFSFKCGDQEMILDKDEGFIVRAKQVRFIKTGGGGP